MTGTQAVPNKGDMTISQLCARFVESYQQQNGGATPTVIEAGIRTDHYFILAELPYDEQVTIIDDDGYESKCPHIYVYGDDQGETSEDTFGELPNCFKPWFQNALQSIAITAGNFTLSPPVERQKNYIVRDGQTALRFTKFGALKVSEEYLYAGSRYIKIDEAHGRIAVDVARPNASFAYLDNVERVE